MKKIVLIALCLAMAACSGVRQTGNTFTTHAESFRILGIALPEDDQARARALVPAGARIENINSSAADWTSLIGILQSILGIHQTVIGGVKESK